jgi:peroxiredoxin
MSGLSRGIIEKKKKIFNIRQILFFFFLIVLLSVSSAFFTSSLSKQLKARKAVRSYVSYRNSLMIQNKSLPGKIIPSVELHDATGKMFHTAYLGGKLSIIYFFTSFDCPYCIEEMAFVDQLALEFGDRINVIAVTSIQSSVAMKNLVEKLSLRCTLLKDNQDEFRKPLDISVNSVKIIASAEGKILEIDPPTFRIKKEQEKFTERLYRLLVEQETHTQRVDILRKGDENE